MMSEKPLPPQPICATRILAPGAMGRGLRGAFASFGKLAQPETPSMAAAMAENVMKSRRLSWVD